MPDYMKYQKSISQELLAIKDRVRYFIDNAHWGEDGRYKEIILMNFLKKVLPTNVSVGTGFVKCNQGLTSQIDIIIYRGDYPTLFSEGDFVIVLPESVIGIIEVKSKLNSDKIRETVEKSDNNGRIINFPIFNGIFCYDSDFCFSTDRILADSIHNSLIEFNSKLNHISFNKDVFVKYWDGGNPEVRDGVRCYSFYNIKDLSYGYFISNLLQYIYGGIDIFHFNDELQNFLYPIREGKEAFRMENLEVRF